VPNEKVVPLVPSASDPSTAPRQMQPPVHNAIDRMSGRVGLCRGGLNVGDGLN
jgi:hypothetical protein